MPTINARRPRIAKPHPVNTMLEAWEEYAESHARRFDSPIGQDYVLGPEWARIGYALHGLLDGDIGDHDAGRFSARIMAQLNEQGYPDEQPADL
jgi:hypothetical protein